MSSSSPTPPSGARPSLSAQRARTVTVCLALASAYAVTTQLAAGPEPMAGALGARLALVAVSVVGLFALAGVLHAFRRAYVSRWHRRLVLAGKAFMGWIQRPKRRPTHAPATPALAAGDRVGLLLGIVLTGLDVVLTTLLLRDVFPTAPYHLPILGELGHEWGFYVLVAGFKTAIEVWLGVIGAGKSSAWRGGLFVLGAASAFDAALALARGLVLADQGLSGPMVMTSNLLFISFGIAVPWVAAYTGHRLALALDPWLARAGLLSLLFALPRYLLLGVAWAVALLVGAVVLVTFGTLALLGSLWFALENMVGLLLGHEDDPRVDFAPFLSTHDDGPRDDEPAGADTHSVRAARVAGGVL